MREQVYNTRPRELKDGPGSRPLTASKAASSDINNAEDIAPQVDRQAPNNLTTAKLNWLAQCTTEKAPVISLLGLRVCNSLVLDHARAHTHNQFQLDGRIIVKPPQSILAGRLGVSRRAIGKAIKKLEQSGLIKIIGKGLGRGHNYQYELVLKGNDTTQQKGTTRPNKRELHDPTKGNELGSHKGSELGSHKGNKLGSHTSFTSCTSDNLFPLKGKKPSDTETQEGGQAETQTTSQVDPLTEFLSVWPVKDSSPEAVRVAWDKYVVGADVDPLVVTAAAKKWSDYRLIHKDVFVSFAGKWLKARGWETKRAPALSREERELVPYFRELNSPAGYSDQRLSPQIRNLISKQPTKLPEDNFDAEVIPKRRPAPRLSPEQFAEALLADNSIASLCDSIVKYVDREMLAKMEADARVLDKHSGPRVARLIASLFRGFPARRLFKKIVCDPDSLLIEIYEEIDHRYHCSSCNVDDVREILQERLDTLRRTAESDEDESE